VTIESVLQLGNESVFLSLSPFLAAEKKSKSQDHFYYLETEIGRYIVRVHEPGIRDLDGWGLGIWILWILWEAREDFAVHVGFLVGC
jgi:hypothetical protein